VLAVTYLILVLLADQDRSLWDAAEIAHARELLDQAIAMPERRFLKRRIAEL
jgi:predicted RNA polymerase sigma factor